MSHLLIPLRETINRAAWASCKPHHHLGFSLIEAMVAVGVASVLAAVGLPWYGDSVRKSKVAEGITLTAPIKAKIAGELLGVERTNRTAYSPSYKCGMNPTVACIPPIAWQSLATNPSSNIGSIVRAGNVVVVNYSAQVAGTDGTLYSLVLVGNQNAAGIQWDCLADAAAASTLSRLSGGTVPVQTPLPAKWAPKDCRTT